MFKKSILAAILFVSTFSANAVLSNQANLKSSANSSTELKCINSKQFSYTYERVLIDGVWWIIVYNDDGAIINKYEDPIQD